MVVSMDVGDETTIHPADKKTISQRLSYWALANTYGRKGLLYQGPAYKSMTKVKDTVNLVFAFAGNGLTSFGKELADFEVAGADKIFYPAKAIITGKGIRVASGQVREPVAVRYAFKDWVQGDLYSTEGLPAVPFRTDDWDAEDK
jgi:sialate O-acetylesterase